MNPRRWHWYAAVALVLLPLWLAYAAWQWHEYGHERRLAMESVGRQADTVHRVLVGSILSHRRVGPFFDAMVQGSLDEMARSEEILAVGIAADESAPQRGILLAAGNDALLDLNVPVDRIGFRFIDHFRLEPEPGAYGGGGGAGGGGGGRGWGRALRADAEEGVFRAGETYATVLVLDRAETDRQVRRAFWLRLWAVAAAGLVLALLTLAWSTTVRLLESRSQARLLRSEADHLRDMSQAAAGLAHETRNPLGLVRGWTQRLAQSPLVPAEQRQQAQAVIEECDRITVRINQFLSYAKPCDPKPERVDLEALLAELAAILQPDLESKNLKIETLVEHRPAVVDVDREMFRQAIFNLLSNAIEFAPPGAAIEIRLARGRAGAVRVEIADPGPGVPADRADLLFSPYFTTRPNGTGLGLAIVRRIARAHGWRAGYRPRPGGGSIFWLDHADGR